MSNICTVALHEILSSRTLSGGCAAVTNLLDKAIAAQFTSEKSPTGEQFFLSKTGATVDSPDEQGRTPLMLACARHSPTVIRHVLNVLKADPNSNYLVDPDSRRYYSPLACSAGAVGDWSRPLTGNSGGALKLHQKEMLLALIPLHMVINRADLELADSLSLINTMVTERGADVNACDSSGHSALYLACVRGSVQLIEFLLRLGASDAPLLSHLAGSTAPSRAIVPHPPLDVEGPSCVRGDEGLYVFSWRIAERPASEPFPPLLKKRHALAALMARRDIINEGTMLSLIDQLISPQIGGSELNMVSSGGFTALSVACAHQRETVIAHLLAVGADTDGSCRVCSGACVDRLRLQCGAHLPLIALLMRNNIIDEDAQAELVRLLVDVGGDLSIFSAADLSSACRSRTVAFKRKMMKLGGNFHRWALQS